jgi:hypothetical protein
VSPLYAAIKDPRTMSNPNDGSNRASAVPRWRRRPAAFFVGAIIVAALALPVLAAEPSPGPSTSPGSSATASPSPSAQPTPTTQPTATATVAPPRSAPTASPQPAQTDEPGGAKPDKANKGNKTPKVAITLRGTVATATDAKGRPTFSMTSGGTTYELGAGPPWFWGANNPLAKFAGKTVTITGETHVGATDVDVLTVDGTAIRAPGKPPWAGGWKVVGETHPGWSQAKADKFKAKFGDCWPPGHCKQAETAPNTGPLGD